MKVNKWTVGLAAAGLVSLPSDAQSEEKASPIMSALSSTMISGYVNTSVWWVPGTGNANQPGFLYSGAAGVPKADGFNLDVVKLSVERPLDEGQWSAGYKFDLLFGPDANQFATTSSSSSTPGSNISDFAIKQAYVALRAPVGNGLDIKLGVWDTIVGYETFDAGNNPNYTRSYGYTIEPTTHTGVLLTYQLNEMFGLAVGMANTFGPAINVKADGGHQAAGDSKGESYKTLMASVAFTAPESMGFMQGSTLYAGVINGFDTFGGGEDKTHWYLGGAIATPVTGLKLGASMDYVAADSETGNVNPYAGAYALYASFAVSEKLSVHGRAEYANTDIEGTFSPVVAGPGVGARKVFAFTGTVQYDLWKNVLSRFEARWDHAASGSDAYGGETPTAAPNRRNNFIFAANLVYKF